MNPEDQIKAVAELDDPHHKWEIAHSPHNEGKVGYRYPAHDGWIYAKRYTESYDAIIPVIQKQSDEIKTACDILVLDENNSFFDVTPAQLTEALLRFTGKWKG